MLPGIEECAQGDRSAQQNKARAFAHPIWRHGANQARIVDLIDGKKFGHSCHAFVCDAPCWPAAAGWSESIFSATRIFALRARGLAAISASEACITFFVKIFSVPSRASR